MPNVLAVVAAVNVDSLQSIIEAAVYKSSLRNKKKRLCVAQSISIDKNSIVKHLFVYESLEKLTEEKLNFTNEERREKKKEGSEFNYKRQFFVCHHTPPRHTGIPS